MRDAIIMKHVALGHTGWVDSCRPKGRGFESRSSRHEETLGKSFTCSCLWRFGVKTQPQCQLMWSGALLKGLCCEKRYRNGYVQYNTIVKSKTLQNEYSVSD